MGLSASQARLLNLTARMHDIEYKAQNLEAQKLQMANESDQVYQEYEDALNKTKIQQKYINADGSTAFEDVTAEKLQNAGYSFEIAVGDNKGRVYKTFNGAINQLITDGIITSTTSTTQQSGINGLPNTPSNGLGQTSPVRDPITTLPNQASTIAGTNAQVTALINEGYIVLVKLLDKENKVYTTDDSGTYINDLIADNDKAPNSYEVNVATDTGLQEVSDELELKKAEAKYEADMRKINHKDKKFDTDLAAMEQERNAIKTEMDTLKSVAKDNVDRTYKLFS